MSETITSKALCMVTLGRCYVHLSTQGDTGTRTIEALRVLKAAMELLKVKDLLDQSISKIKLISNFRLRMETLVIFFIAKRLAFLLEINDPIEKKVKLNYIDLIFCYFKGIIKCF